MPELQAAVVLPWQDCATVQAAVVLPWQDGATVQSVGSPYTPPSLPPGGVVVTPGSLAPLHDITPQLVYEVASSLSVLDLRTGDPLPVTSVEIAFSDGSALWELRAVGRGGLADLLEAGEQPATLQVTINADVWCFVVDQVDRPQAFNSSQCTLRGRSLAALAGAPWQVEQTWIADAPTTAAQVCAAAQTFTGLEVDWRLDDWLIPAGAWSFTGDPLAVVVQMARAVGADVEAHRSEMRVTVRPRYAVLPNLWATTRPDWQVPWRAVESSQRERADKPDYDGVVLTGQQAGDVFLGRLAGTSGSKQAPMVSDPLLTDLAAMRQRAEALLGGYGKQTRETRTLQVHGSVIGRGELVRNVDPAVTWSGVVRSLSVAAAVDQAGRRKARQTVVMERHTAFVVGTAAPAELCVLDPYFNGPQESGRTVLVLHGRGLDQSREILDSSVICNVMVPMGNAMVSAAAARFGATSIFLDGSGSYVKAADPLVFDFGVAPHTLEAHCLPGVLIPGMVHCLFSGCEGITGGFAYWYVGVLPDGRIQAYCQPSTGGSGPVAVSTQVLSPGAWRHVAFDRDGASAVIKVDGEVWASSSAWVTFPTAKLQHFAIGGLANGYADSSFGYWHGHLAEVRATERVSRYPAPFAPPAQPFCDHS